MLYRLVFQKMNFRDQELNASPYSYFHHVAFDIYFTVELINSLTIKKNI